MDAEAQYTDKRMHPAFVARMGIGRTKGTQNHQHAVRLVAKSLIEDPEYLLVLKCRLIAGDAPHMETLLWHYAYGKPKEKIEIQAVPLDLAELSDEELAARAAEVSERLLADSKQRLLANTIEVVAESDAPTGATPISSDRPVLTSAADLSHPRLVKRVVPVEPALG